MKYADEGSIDIKGRNNYSKYEYEKSTYVQENEISYENNELSYYNQPYNGYLNYVHSQQKSVLGLCTFTYRDGQKRKVAYYETIGIYIKQQR